MIDAAAIWERWETLHQRLHQIERIQLETLHNQQRILTRLGDIMTEVQVDQAVIDGATTAITALANATETLVTAVTTFLEHPVVTQLPDAVTSGLSAAIATAGTAVTDAGNAQTALTNAAPTTPPVVTPPAAEPPAIASVAPSTGSVAGGDSVVITGTGFTDASAVTFGLDAATSFTVVSDTEIDAVAPVPSAGSGTVDVTVTTPAGTSTTDAADQFTTA